MLEQGQSQAAVAAAMPADRGSYVVDDWVNAVARNDLGSADAGFASMLARASDTPAASRAREPAPADLGTGFACPGGGQFPGEGH
jgi:hypothetical protein